MGITVWKCSRCGWEWASRRGKLGKPVTCPNCRSPYWDKERKVEQGHRTSP